MYVNTPKPKRSAVSSETVSAAMGLGLSAPLAEDFTEPLEMSLCGFHEGSQGRN